MLSTSTGSGGGGGGGNSHKNSKQKTKRKSSDPFSLTRSSSRGGDASRSRQMLVERDAHIAALRREVRTLSDRLSMLTRQANSFRRKGGGQRRAVTPHRVLIRESTSSSSRAVHRDRQRLGRNASMNTAVVLDALPEETPDELATRLVDVCKNPARHLDYLQSRALAKDLLTLCRKVRPVLEDEPKCVFVRSPCYVFGDVHGNLEDLHFFSDNVWRLGMELTAGNFVFLGDYVDRGLSCLEVVAYLLATKLLLPHKVYLLRGNHETRDVNGWEEHYGDRCFIHQCRERFGDEIGYRVWEEINRVFDRMPLAAVIDRDIFCVHGGIPRPCPRLDGDGGEDSRRRASPAADRLQDILSVPRVAGINPPYQHEPEIYQRVASDCIWSDPASDEQERRGVDPATGFGESLRGGGAICFGHKAVTDFLDQHGLSYVMRAHEAHAEGVAVSKGARVFTVFSTSQDHNQGDAAMAGCILVDFEKMQVINRSAAYRNKYVHRRDSVTVQHLDPEEIDKRIELGLITHADSDSDDNELEYEDAEEDYDEDDEGAEYEEESFDGFSDDEDDDEDEDDDDRNARDENLVLDVRRRSLVDPAHTVASPHGAAGGKGAFSFDDADAARREGGGVDFEAVFDESQRRPIRSRSERLSALSERTEGTEETDGDTIMTDENHQAATTTTKKADDKDGKSFLRRLGISPPTSPLSLGSPRAKNK